MAKDPWDRASLDFNVRPDKVARDITREDLMLPAGGGTGRMLAVCLVCGVMFSLLFVWTTLMLFAYMGLVGARTLYTVVAAVAIVSGTAFFAFASWDFRRWREWADNA